MGDASGQGGACDGQGVCPGEDVPLSAPSEATFFFSEVLNRNKFYTPIRHVFQ